MPDHKESLQRQSDVLDEKKTMISCQRDDDGIGGHCDVAPLFRSTVIFWMFAKRVVKYWQA